MPTIHEITRDLAAVEEAWKPLHDRLCTVLPGAPEEATLEEAIAPLNTQVASLRRELAHAAPANDEEALALLLVLVDVITFDGDTEHEHVLPACVLLVDYIAAKAGRRPADLGIFRETLQTFDHRIGQRGLAPVFTGDRDAPN